MKKNINKKQGFSLIELIVVIAVIAAIAAVIVPSISNFSNTATTTSEARNVQLWTATYLQALAAECAGLPDAATDDTHLPAIEASQDIDGDGANDVTFSSPAVAVSAGKVVFNAATGASYTAD